jgi:ubiquinone/menaquinone biosynthesis C-methylase UbiE
MHTALIDRKKNDRGSIGTDPRNYPLGYSDSEFRRLEQQSTFYADLTEDVLRRAGVKPGMRVLDVGCGVGDVSMLAAWLVGPSGAVLGIDRSAEAVDTAARRAAAVRQDWARFAAADLDAFTTDETFDAVIGRLILFYLPDAAATLRRLSSYVRPGGIVAFHEMVMSLTRSVPDGRLFGEMRYWIVETYERAGLDFDMGGRLYATFLSAGLPAPQMIGTERVEGGPQSPVYDYIAETLRSLLPTMERLGVATAAEVEVDTFAERLRRETVGSNACIMLPPLVGAWTRTAT